MDNWNEDKFVALVDNEANGGNDEVKDVNSLFKPKETTTEKNHWFFLNKEAQPTRPIPDVIAEAFKNECNILYADGSYWQYIENIWKPITKPVLLSKLYNFVIDKAKLFGVDSVVKERLKNQIISEIEYPHLITVCKMDGIFKTPPIQCSNGILELKEGHWQLRDPKPSDYSRNLIPLAYNPTATCTRFLNEFIAPNLDNSDRSLLQLLCGQFLAGYNIAQKILILSGSGGSGKSTLANIIKEVVGRNNCTELRTKNLGERFETSRFIGKTLLEVPDASPDTLTYSNAGYLKQLTGSDLMSVEFKCSNDQFQIQGNYNVLIISNSRLLVRLNGDESAWKRRLVIIEFNHVPVNKIERFDQVLLKEEGSGILNWMLEGLRMLKSGESNIDELCLQSGKVEALLYESDSVKSFIDARIIKAQSDLTTDEMYRAYENFCIDTDTFAISKDLFSKRAKDNLKELGAIVDNNILRSKGRFRGYSGICLKI